MQESDADVRRRATVGGCPVQCVHSKAEIEWLLVVRFLHKRSPGTLAEGLDILKAGDACARSDGVTSGYVCEYDEALYHTDVQRDIRKTERILLLASKRW